MSAPQFTKGPWHSQDLKQKHPRFGIVTAKNVIVARAWIEPDARLIAAAPELYRELANAVVLLRAAGVHETQNGTIRAAEAALRKARGEQQ